MDEREQVQFEAHIKETAWHRVLSEAAKDDDDGASVFRMARMAASEAWIARAALASEPAQPVNALEFAIEALVAAGHVSRRTVDMALALAEKYADQNDAASSVASKEEPTS